MLHTPGWIETSERSTATAGGETTCNHSSLQGGEVSWRGEKSKLKVFPFFVFEEYPIMLSINQCLDRCIRLTLPNLWPCRLLINWDKNWREWIKRNPDSGKTETRPLDVLEKSVNGGILSSKCLLAKVTKWKMWRVWMTIANQLLNFVPDSGSHECTV